jgi:hypothetical protein
LLLLTPTVLGAERLFSGLLTISIRTLKEVPPNPQFWGSRI